MTTNPRYEEETLALEKLYSLTDMCYKSSKSIKNAEVLKVLLYDLKKYSESLFTDKTPPKTMLCAVAICTACEDIIENVDWNKDNSDFWFRLSAKLEENTSDIQRRTKSVAEKGPKSLEIINIDEIHELYRMVC